MMLSGIHGVSEMSLPTGTCKTEAGARRYWCCASSPRRTSRLSFSARAAYLLALDKEHKLNLLRVDLRNLGVDHLSHLRPESVRAAHQQ